MIPRPIFLRRRRRWPAAAAAVCAALGLLAGVALAGGAIVSRVCGA